MTKKILFFGIVIFMLFLFNYFMENRMDKIHADRFNDFNRSDLNGIILDFSTNRRDTEIKLDNDTVNFFPVTSSLNNNNIFGFTAKKGDSIIKNAFNDTLILKKSNGKIFKYTFLKSSDL
ncbi:hypothetical protein [Chryseobacterium sp. HMWF035]|uniref:hypothetical protein n=2 Tax=unclassified Chryseobacterium TaxID=2593645 RepID=UPI000D57E2E4|nr:hypothetical protein [Chryseobacterium sp. HMWF035]PVV56430.1 hypothetical protein DD829_11085 [Chryseobacterium sp. HMWF035]